MDLLQELLKSAFIGAVQGITEFLPVSSSGHILLLKYLLELDIKSIFDIVLHVGTLGAVIIFYRREIGQLIIGLFKPSLPRSMFGPLTRSGVARIWLLFIIATIPGGIAGLFLEPILDLEPETMQRWHFLLIAGSFIVTALLLLSTLFFKPKKQSGTITEISPLKALIIGCFQALAILPGVSRSGATISSALGLGINKEDASRFSFMLSIPLILAAFILKVIKLMRDGINVETLNIGVLAIGFVVSFAIGLLSLVLLLRIIKKGSFWLFSIYLAIPFIISLVLSFMVNG